MWRLMVTLSIPGVLDKREGFGEKKTLLGLYLFANFNLMLHTVILNQMKSN